MDLTNFSWNVTNHLARIPRSGRLPVIAEVEGAPHEKFDVSIRTDTSSRGALRLVLRRRPIA